MQPFIYSSVLKMPAKNQCYQNKNNLHHHVKHLDCFNQLNCVCDEKQWYEAGRSKKREDIVSVRVGQVMSENGSSVCCHH